MRHLFFALLLAVGCSGDKTQTLEQGAAPNIMPADERAHCPTFPMNNRSIDDIHEAIMDSEQNDRFDELDVYRDDDGIVVNATFHNGHDYYKMYYARGDRYGTSTLSFSERTHRPFSLDSLTDHILADAYYDQGLDGCVNYGQSLGGETGTLEWLHDTPHKGLEHHSIWQYRLQRTVRTLVIILWDDV